MTTSTPYENSNPLQAWIDDQKILVGMVHLGALPGAPGATASPSTTALKTITENALRDARTILAGGMSGLIVENFGDAPFYPDHVPATTIASMTIVAQRIRDLVDREFPSTSPAPFLGINVLRNDADAALAIAATSGFHGIRVNVHAGVMASDQGLLEGQAHVTLRERERLGADVAILADVLVKHAEPVGPSEPDIGVLAKDLVHRGGADAVIVSGKATGSPTDPACIAEVREALPDTPLLVGSGVTVDNLATQLESADGAIIGTALKENGDVYAPVDPQRVRAFVEAATP